MKKREAEFQAAFSRWLKHEWDEGPAAFELKRTESGSLALKNIKDHQIAALMQVIESRHVYKIPDDSFAQKPYDCFILKGSAYVAIAYGPRLRGFYLINAPIISRFKERGIRSITEFDASEVGRYVEFPRRRASQ